MGKNHALRWNDMGSIRLAALWQSDGEDIQHMHDMTWEKQLESEEAFTDEIPFNSDNDTEQQ